MGGGGVESLGFRLQGSGRRFWEEDSGSKPLNFRALSSCIQKPMVHRNVIGV